MPIGDALLELESIRLQEQEALERRYEVATALDPKFSELAERRKDAAIRAGRSIQYGMSADNAAAQAKSELNAIDIEEQELLKAVGLDEHYLKLKVHCPICKDTGYIGNPRRPCTCLVKRLMDQQRASSKLSIHETFEEFKTDVYPNNAQRDEMIKVKDIAEAYANALPNPKKQNLVMLGEPGLGKTFMLNAIASRALLNGIIIRKITAYTFIDELLMGIRSNIELSSPYINVPLLLIDDLGTEPMMNNITCEYLFSVLNERWAGGLNTVIATNLSIDGLQERYGERVFSRIVNRENTILIKMAGENLRLINLRDKNFQQ